MLAYGSYGSWKYSSGSLSSLGIPSGKLTQMFGFTVYWSFSEAFSPWIFHVFFFLMVRVSKTIAKQPPNFTISGWYKPSIYGWLIIAYQSQMLHVWNIYLHLLQKLPKYRKYSIHGAFGNDHWLSSITIMETTINHWIIVHRNSRILGFTSCRPSHLEIAQ